MASGSLSCRTDVGVLVSDTSPLSKKRSPDCAEPAPPSRTHSVLVLSPAEVRQDASRRFQLDRWPAARNMARRRYRETYFLRPTAGPRTGATGGINGREAASALAGGRRRGGRRVAPAGERGAGRISGLRMAHDQARFGGGDSSPGGAIDIVDIRIRALPQSRDCRRRYDSVSYVCMGMGGPRAENQSMVRRSRARWLPHKEPPHATIAL